MKEPKKGAKTIKFFFILGSNPRCRCKGKAVCEAARKNAIFTCFDGRSSCKRVKCGRRGVGAGSKYVKYGRTGVGAYCERAVWASRIDTFKEGEPDGL